MNKWIRLSKPEAEQHPLYGVGLVLNLILGTLAFGAVLSLGWFSALFLTAYVEYKGLLLLLLWIGSYSGAIAYWGYTKNRDFRIRSIVLLILNIPMQLTIAVGFPSILNAMDSLWGAQLAGQTFWTVLIVLYLIFSRKVRVTYERLVQASDPYLVTCGRIATYRAGVGNDGVSEQAQEPRNVASARAESGPESDQECFDVLAAELARGERDEGLWLQSYMAADGDEAKAKARYIRLRVAKLFQMKDLRSDDTNKVPLAKAESSSLADPVPSRPNEAPSSERQIIKGGGRVAGAISTSEKSDAKVLRRRKIVRSRVSVDDPVSNIRTKVPVGAEHYLKIGSNGNFAVGDIVRALEVAGWKVDARRNRDSCNFSWSISRSSETYYGEDEASLFATWKALDLYAKHRPN